MKVPYDTLQVDWKLSPPLYLHQTDESPIVSFLPECPSSHLLDQVSGGRREEMNRKLYVGSIAYETTEADLEQLFSQAGAVESVRVMRDMATGRARGFAFVEMATEAEAQAAIDQLHDKPFGGRTLTVNEARPQPARSGGFGGGGRDHRGGGGGGSRRREPRW
jgi:cold-inducible RNA-binding protein